MSFFSEENERRRSRLGVAESSAALTAVGAIASVGLLISGAGLLTVDDGTTAALYAGGLGAGLVALLCIGVVTGARGQAPADAQTEERLAQQVEIHADRIERVARSLGGEHQWERDALLKEIELAESGYDLAVELGATEHAHRLSSALAYVNARTGLKAEPRSRRGVRRQTI